MGGAQNIFLLAKRRLHGGAFFATYLQSQVEDNILFRTLGIYNFANRPTKPGRPRLRVTKPAKSLPEAKKLVAFSRTWVGKKKILKHQITKKIQIHVFNE